MRTNHSAYESQSVSIEDPSSSQEIAPSHGSDGEVEVTAAKHVDRHTIDIVRVVDGRAAENWGARV